MSTPIAIVPNLHIQQADIANLTKESPESLQENLPENIKVSLKQNKINHDRQLGIKLPCGCEGVCNCDEKPNISEIHTEAVGGIDELNIDPILGFELAPEQIADFAETDLEEVIDQSILRQEFKPNTCGCEGLCTCGQCVEIADMVDPIAFSADEIQNVIEGMDIIVPAEAIHLTDLDKANIEMTEQIDSGNNKYQQVDSIEDKHVIENTVQPDSAKVAKQEIDLPSADKSSDSTEEYKNSANNEYKQNNSDQEDHATEKAIQLDSFDTAKKEIDLTNVDKASATPEEYIKPVNNEHKEENSYEQKFVEEKIIEPKNLEVADNQIDSIRVEQINSANNEYQEIDNKTVREVIPSESVDIIEKITESIVLEVNFNNLEKTESIIVKDSEHFSTASKEATNEQSFERINEHARTEQVDAAKSSLAETIHVVEVKNTSEQVREIQEPKIPDHKETDLKSLKTNSPAKEVIVKLVNSEPEKAQNPIKEFSATALLMKANDQLIMASEKIQKLLSPLPREELVKVQVKESVNDHIINTQNSIKNTAQDILFRMIKIVSQNQSDNRIDVKNNARATVQVSVEQFSKQIKNVEVLLDNPKIQARIKELDFVLKRINQVSKIIDQHERLNQSVSLLKNQHIQLKSLQAQLCYEFDLLIKAQTDSLNETEEEYLTINESDQIFKERYSRKRRITKHPQYPSEISQLLKQKQESLAAQKKQRLENGGLTQEPAAFTSKLEGTTVKIKSAGIARGPSNSLQGSFHGESRNGFVI